MSSTPTVDPPRFDQLLRRYKREGCNLLLVGRLPEQMRRRVSRLLLGAASERRYRLLVTTHGESVEQRLPTGLDDASRERIRVVDQLVGAHRADKSTPSNVDSSRATDDALRLADVRAEILKQLSALNTIDGGVEPGQLRVGFDSLAPLLATHEVEEVRSFLGEVTERVRTLRGIGHYFLPVEFGARIERELRPQFDAVLEQHVVNSGDVFQRWHVTDEALSTGWVPV